MLVELLEAHLIDNALREKGEILDLPAGVQVTPLMKGLDDEAIEAIKLERIRVYGRYENTPPGWPPQGPPVDDPPIPRPLTENQPVYHYVGAQEYLGGNSPAIPGIPYLGDYIDKEPKK